MNRDISTWALAVDQLNIVSILKSIVPFHQKFLIWPKSHVTDILFQKIQQERLSS